MPGLGRQRAHISVRERLGALPGRTPWYRQLSDPCVISVLSAYTDRSYI